MLGGGKNTQGGSGTGQTGLRGLLGLWAQAALAAYSVLALGNSLIAFKQSGQADTVDSWVSTGPNKQIAARLSRELPNAVDKYTPQGRLPTPA